MVTVRLEGDLGDNDIIVEAALIHVDVVVLCAKVSKLCPRVVDQQVCWLTHRTGARSWLC